MPLLHSSGYDILVDIEPKTKKLRIIAINIVISYDYPTAQVGYSSSFHFFHFKNFITAVCICYKV